MLKYLIQYKFSILLAAIITLLSLLPSSAIPDSPLFSFRFVDKVVHFGMYGALALVALLERRCQKRCFPKEFLLLFLIFLMSFTEEVLQATLIPSRAAEWFDLIANALGIAAAWLTYSFFRRFIS